ncbi:MAG: flagellar biosynthesis protein FlhF [Lachnospiraceae bacterium]|nr:flagellar biosynthesis protein FlhF [Lachnospiraceae bacterium]
MIIKKYQGKTEEEATLKAKEELGSDAVIMNVKSVKHKGLQRVFKKNYYEVTAAVDEPSDRIRSSGRTGSRTMSEEDQIRQDILKAEEARSMEDVSLTAGFRETDGRSGRTSSAIEERLDNLTEIIEKQMNTVEPVMPETVHRSQMVQLVLDQLVNNEVTEANANEILREIDYQNKQQLEDLLASVYQKIVLKLGQMKTIEVEKEGPKIVFFIGPTGVGKTTTIAKLASKYKLEKKCKLAIITADTYRIAAVEQIRTYANILSVPIEVVYTSDEIKAAIDKYQEYDLIFIDTAGRSHNNNEQREDVKKMIESIRGYHQEIYLVLSATTKYRDLVKITQAYSDITNYRIIFTKIDETSALGNVLNIRMMTNAPLSYTTFGQNVPDDIVVTDAQFIAKQLLGGNE